MGTDRENIVPGDLYIMKGNIRYQQKAIFYIKKKLPIQSKIYSCSKNSKHLWQSALFQIKTNAIQNH